MIKEVDCGLLFSLKIVPNSSKNVIVTEDDYIKVKITAQPVENKANKQLIEYLSKEFKIAKTNIEIVKGQTSKEKTILIKISDSSKKAFIISKLTNK